MRKKTKYKVGDCLEFSFKNSRKLGVIITNIYNSYYDLSLTNIDSTKDLSLVEFHQCMIFGTRSGSTEEMKFLVNVRMLKTSVLDKLESVRLIGNIELPQIFDNDGYSYLKNIEELESYFDEEINVRIQKTKNAEKFPNLGFMSKNLLSIEFLK